MSIYDGDQNNETSGGGTESDDAIEEEYFPCESCEKV